jgi:hypothetical protein
MLGATSYQAFMSPAQPSPIDENPEWGSAIPELQWSVYRSVIHQARSKHIPFAFGGAFAAAVYTGILRNTKDFDFYILPADREIMRDALTQAGLQDYYDQLPYDRSWIYRSNRKDIIVDAIWAMANHRAEVDAEWLSRGPEVAIRGERLRAIPVEELLWCKLYIIQRERCDWVDVLNLLDARADSIDWDHLLDRLAVDIPLLGGALAVFAWLAPDRARDIPSPVWSHVGLTRPSLQNGSSSRERVDLLDSRPWFTRFVRQRP